ncbi:MAG: ribonuclease III [Clostridiales bacterium]|nr:ribonuclease III [Clostridiales bacterium]
MRDDRDKKMSLLAQKLGLPEEKLPWLVQALTHATFFEGGKSAEQQDNQRLEFLGDAVLDLLVSECLFERYPLAREGDLTKMRSALVCEVSLARHAKKLDLGEALLMGRGGEAGGDRRRPSVLADAFEAVLGAVYVSCGYASARRFVLEQMGEELDNLSKEDYEDSKSLLQEFVQTGRGEAVCYRLLSCDGPSHAPVFVMGVFCGDVLLGEGKGGSKKEGEQMAAKAALADKERWQPLLSEFGK